MLKNLILISVLIPFSYSNADQTQISNYSKARKLHWSNLYPKGGYTLYCGQSFEIKDGFNVEHIYPAIVDSCSPWLWHSQTMPADL